MSLKFVKKFIKLIKITNFVCVAVYVYATVVMLLWCAHHSNVTSELVWLDTSWEVKFCNEVYSTLWPLCGYEVTVEK